MRLKILTIVLFFLSTFRSVSQDSIQKKTTIGLGVSVSYSYGTPDYFAKTPLVFIRHRKHELSVGLDYYHQNSYEGSITGIQGQYKFFLLRQTRPFNIYALTNFQYVRFGQGYRWDIPYKYAVRNNLPNQRTFNNTFGLGFFLEAYKTFSFNVEYSYGYSYLEWHSTYTDKGTFSTPFYKFGILVNFYKW